MKKDIKLALISPSKSAYSETFIKAHKDYLDADVSYYYGGFMPCFLDGKYSLLTLKRRVANKINQKLFRRFKTSLEYALYRSFKREKVQVVLAEYGPTGDAILEVCKALNLPLIVHFHGYDASRKDVIEDHGYYKNLFHYAIKVVVVSQTMRIAVENMGCDGKKIVVNPCSPNSSYLKIKPMFSEPLLVGVGRFVDKKAPYYLLFAFKEVFKKNNNAKLIIAGDGPLLNACWNIARHLGVSDAVEFPGVISSDNLKELLSKATAFVQHSVTAMDGDMEGTPVSVLEGSAAGLPVISTRHAGIPDVIMDQESGILVDEHDVRAMADAMSLMLDNHDLAKKMGENGKKHIATHFSMDKHIALLDEVIYTAISK